MFQAVVDWEVETGHNAIFDPRVLRRSGEAMCHDQHLYSTWPNQACTFLRVGIERPFVCMPMNCARL